MRSRITATQNRGPRMASLTVNMLRTAYAGPDAPKRMARDAGTSHRTAEKWWARLTTPRADVLLRMTRENEALRAEMLRALSGEAYAGLVADVAGAPGAAEGAALARSGGAAAAAVAGAVGRVALSATERRLDGTGIPASRATSNHGVSHD